MIHFRAINEDNFDTVINMTPPEGEPFVSSNAYSLAQAWLYRHAGDVHVCAVYDDDVPVGFMMLDADDDPRGLILWRIVIARDHRGRGCGTAAVRELIRLARESGRYDSILLGCTPGNDDAEHIYRKLGFVPTGRMEYGEAEFRLVL
ncbi:MAG: GNAT family N-acetyltransferase [Clostridia bacterium]|nr:GNAT family N-acetyltransferase [Clostridia bacterium]